MNLIERQIICFLFCVDFHTDHDIKSIILLSPDVRIQTESKKSKNAGSGQSGDVRKKSIIDSGIELLFKKSPKSTSAGAFGQSPPKISHPLASDYYKYSADITTVPVNYVDKESSSHHGHSAMDEHHKWKLFDTIKIHTDKRRSIDPNGKMKLKQNPLSPESNFRFFQLMFTWVKNAVSVHKHTRLPRFTSCITIRLSSISMDRRRRNSVRC